MRSPLNLPRIIASRAAATLSRPPRPHSARYSPWDDGSGHRCYAPAIMTEYQSDLLRILSGRGYIHQVTDAAALDALAAKQIVPAYIGSDATAPSRHGASRVQFRLLRRLQKAGHKPIVVMGGGTTKVGDPSGK